MIAFSILAAIEKVCIPPQHFEVCGKAMKKMCMTPKEVFGLLNQAMMTFRRRSRRSRVRRTKLKSNTSLRMYDINQKGPMTSPGEGKENRNLRRRSYAETIKKT